MKVVILAGGFGTRLSEETHFIPKPMVEIGGYPLIWHIMKIYSEHGFHDFVICLGYKGKVIKNYFFNYHMNHCDVTIDLTKNNEYIIHRQQSEPWKITLVETGLHTMTGGRIKRIQPFIGEEPFMLTYGDGLGDVNITALVKFHKTHGKYATVTAVQPLGRFGALNLKDDHSVNQFQEKKSGDGGWINAGFFVFQPEIFNYLHGDETVLESSPLETLTSDGQLMAFRHSGFWQPMDTLKDKHRLEELWNSGNPNWRIWHK